MGDNMFEEKDLNFRETFSMAIGIVKSNKKDLAKAWIKYILFCFVIFFALGIFVAFYGTSYNANIVLIVVVYIIGIIAILIKATETIVYMEKLFYGSLYEKNYTKEEVVEFTKKRRFKYLGMMILLAVVVLIANFGIFFIAGVLFTLAGVTVETIPIMLFSDTAFTIKYMIIFIMVIIAEVLVINLTAFYRYELATNPANNMGTDVPFKVMEGKTKEFFKLIMWNFGLYIGGGLFLFITSTLIIYVMDAFMYSNDFVIAIVVILLSLLYFFLMMFCVTYYMAFGNTKYFNMRNMVFGKPDEEVSVEFPMDEQNNNITSALNKNEMLESEEDKEN